MEEPRGSDLLTQSPPGHVAGWARAVPLRDVIEQVEWFTWWILALSAFATVLDLALVAMGVFPRALAPILFAASTVGFLVAWLLARAHLPWPSVAVSMVTLGGVTIAASVFLPSFFVVMAVIPACGSLIAVPFLRGRPLIAMLVFLWVVGIVGATVGAALHLPTDVGVIGVVLTALTLAIAGAFFSYNLTRLSARFRGDRDRALASEAQYRTLFDGSPVTMLVFDPATFRILAANLAAEQMYATTRASLLTLTLVDLLDPTLQPRLDLLRESLQRDAYVPLPTGWRHRRADGSVIDVEGASHLIPFGGGHARLSVILDVTAARRAAAAAEEATARLEEAQAIAHVGSWAALPGETGFDDGVTSWSSEGLLILGLPAGTPGLPGAAFYDFVHPDDRDDVVEAGHRAVAAGEPYDVEHRIVRPDGLVRFVHERGELNLDPAGRPVRFAGTIEDVTDRRELERRLASAERLEAVGRLAGGVAHDFNNLLTVIAGNAEIALDLTAEDEPARPAMEAVVDAARRSAGLTHQLLAFARRQRLEPRPVDLVGVVDALASTIRDLVGPRIEVTIAHRRPGTVVLADHAGCDQILLNLVSNARDAMPDGGRLAIETGIAPALHGGPAAGLLVVRDSGVGMTAETAAHMFEPFFTTRVAGTHGVAATGPVGAGTGLGLAIVHGIVEQSGGSIEVESRPGDGTSFWVRLPLAASVDEEQTPAVVGASARVRGRILVVEDDADVAAFVSTALVGAGHDVRVAPSAEAACDILAAAGPSACPAPFDLVLTDVVMPGMSGWDLADQIRRDSPGTGVVLMSGYARERGPSQGDQHAWPMLEKPFSIAALGAIVGAALERGSAGAGQASRRG